MILGFGAYIAVWQLQLVCHQGTLCDGSRCNASYGSGLGELCVDEVYQLILHKRAQLLALSYAFYRHKIQIPAEDVILHH